jgi:hypothetical protein
MRGIAWKQCTMRFCVHVQTKELYMSEQRQTRILAARIWSRQNVITTVLGTFIVLSLLIHAFTIFSLLRVRSIVSSQLDVSAGQVAQLRQQKIPYNFPVEQTFPINTTVVISETVDVPINLRVPIQQTVRLPINTPVGPLQFDVPLDFTVPISDSVRVPINKSIPFSTTIPISTSIPIDVSLSDGPVGNVLQHLEEGLRDLRQQLYR